MQAMKQRHQSYKDELYDKKDKIAVVLRKAHLRVQSDDEQVHRTGNKEEVDCETDNMPQTIPDRGSMLDTFKNLKMLPQNRSCNAERKKDSAKPNDCGGKMYPSDEQFDNWSHKRVK